MIVGIETETMVTFWHYPRARKAHAMMLTTTRRELHATKGWRQISRTKVYASIDPDRKPSRTFDRYTNHKEREGLKQLSEADMEKARLRHKWYRTEKAIEAFRASLPAGNVDPKFHTEAQRGQLKAENGLVSS